MDFMPTEFDQSLKVEQIQLTPSSNKIKCYRFGKIIVISVNGMTKTEWTNLIGSASGIVVPVTISVVNSGTLYYGTSKVANAQVYNSTFTLSFSDATNQAYGSVMYISG